MNFRSGNTLKAIAVRTTSLFSTRRDFAITYAIVFKSTAKESVLLQRTVEHLKEASECMRGVV